MSSEQASAADPVLIGYFPKRLTPTPGWLDVPGVTEICSVSGCIAEPPDAWIDRWSHNDLWVYDTPSGAEAVIPAGERHAFGVYAYRLLPVLFESGAPSRLEIPALEVAPIVPGFESLGFDAVARSQGTAFDCSPLSCNHMARAIAVNEYCLLRTLGEAIDTARRFSLEEPEPGPYVVVEVLRAT